MATPVLTSLDFTHLQLLNVRLQMLASDPSSPAEAWVYFNSVSHKPRYYDGSAWQDWVGGSSGAVDSVTAGDATITIGGTASDPTVAVAAASLDHTYITDFDTQVRTSRLDQMAAPTASLDFNSHKGVNVLDPTLPQDIATKAYVDALSQGLDFKPSARVIVTTNGTLATAYENGDSAGGVTLATGDRIVLGGQTTGSENGIYTVNASGAPTRAADANASGEISKGTIIFIEAGTNAGQLWVVSATASTPWVPGTDSSTWTQFAGAADITGGAGLVKAGNDLAVGQGTGIVVNANDVAVDTAVVVRKFSQDIGNASSTSIAVTHSLGTKDITYSVRQNSDDAMVLCDVVATSTTVATFTFAVAPGSSALRVVIHA